MNEPQRIRIGVSSCLLGQPVRYDGQHQHDRYLTGILGEFFDFEPVCPEVECGLPVPREAMRLVGDAEAPRLLGQRTGTDHTERMLAWCAKRVDSLKGAGLCGFIFKSKSPSSGLFRVKLYTPAGHPGGVTRGLWAAAFTQAYPNLPVEEEGRLHDTHLREHFIECVYTLKRYRDALRDDPTVNGLMRFHARNKYLLMAYNPAAVKELGQFVAGLHKTDLPDAIAAYETRLMHALQNSATPAKHANVLQHLQGYFSDSLDPEDREELSSCIHRYRDEVLPLIVPITLMAHYVRKYRVAYLADQYYLHPHPLELKLRNHA